MDQLPLDVVLQVVRFEIPHLLRKFSGLLALFCAERVRVGVVTRFEVAFCKSEVVACWFSSCSDGGLVHNTFCQAVSVEWALFFSPAATGALARVQIWC